MNSLQGMFLIATKQMVDPRFKETVILICNHDEEGALGLVLTSRYPEISFENILQSMNLGHGNRQYPDIYCGGPVSLDAFFVLLTTELFDSKKVMNDVYLGNDVQFLTHVSGGADTSTMRFFLGYSGWGAGQLEMELATDGWLVLPASAGDIFSGPPESLWRNVTAKHGVDIDLFIDIAGNA